MKKCSKCGLLKDFDSFYVSKERADGFIPYCKQCQKDNHVPVDFDRKKNVELKRRFGITIEFYNELLMRQDHRCAGCKTPASDLARSLAVDHDHACCSGKKIVCGGLCIRGLLCHKCNSVLGYVNDSAATMTNLVKYLDDHKTSVKILLES